MTAHADTFDRPEPLSKPFWTSLTLHILVLGGLTAGAVLKPASLNMGDKTGGGIGVLVTPVQSIPLPNRGGAENPVANDTESQVPAPPTPKEKIKAIPKPVVPPPDAITLKSDKAHQKKPTETRVQPQAQPRNTFAEKQPVNPNQLYTAGGARASSPNMGMQGDGVRLGDGSPFGEQFGWYANIIRQNIATNWKPGLGRSAAAPSVVVTFTIRRDGSITNVKISKSSGIQAMDFSAQRAIEDTKLPALPNGFPRPQADVEMKFELGN